MSVNLALSLFLQETSDERQVAAQQLFKQMFKLFFKPQTKTLCEAGLVKFT